ncbi:hypothetical protein BKA62DRAFT_690742 [Auriculariales sp. MPI-PUGE-AT-0066]|nr:hypothetical protein BKA62DRAFT_690742 [Auriculariales sp. MPI-PUGE-AT-0066]
MAAPVEARITRWLADGPSLLAGYKEAVELVQIMSRERNDLQQQVDDKARALERVEKERDEALQARALLLQERNGLLQHTDAQQQQLAALRAMIPAGLQVQSLAQVAVARPPDEAKLCPSCCEVSPNAPAPKNDDGNSEVVVQMPPQIKDKPSPHSLLTPSQPSLVPKSPDENKKENAAPNATASTDPETINPALLYLQPVWHPAWMVSQLPARYRNTITTSPRNVDSRAINLRFTRNWLSSLIGGTPQGLNVSVRRDKIRFGVSAYYAVNREGNPWTPHQPGESGFMFVGLNTTDAALGHGEQRELFMKFAVNEFLYFGTYACWREDDLLADEFTNIDWHVTDGLSAPRAQRESDQLRKEYCKWTSEKGNLDNRNIGTIEDALAKYKSGDIRVPCIRLQCVGFNQQLFNFLYSEHTQRSGTSAKTPTSSSKQSLVSIKNTGGDECVTAASDDEEVVDPLTACVATSRKRPLRASANARSYEELSDAEDMGDDGDTTLIELDGTDDENLRPTKKVKL